MLHAIKKVTSFKCVWTKKPYTYK